MAINEAESTTTSSIGVDLTVRCALQSFDDLTVHAQMDWTVKDLKTHLFETCATKPEVNRQRLIYAGHGLEDHQTIRELLDKTREGLESGQELGPQVIHFVCAPKEPPTMQNNGLRHRANAAASNGGTSSTATTAPVTSPDGNAHAFFAQTQVNPGFWQPPAFTLPPNPTAEQVAYYNYYIQYQQAMMSWYMYTYGSHNPNVFQIRYHTNTSVQHFNPAFNNVAPIANNENQPDGGAAPPVADENGNGEQMNDFLGLMYRLVRTGFFLMVLFMYSSIERFLAVFLIVCLLWYVHRRREQNNLNAAARRVVQQAAQDPAAPVANDQNNNEVQDEPVAPNATAPPPPPQVEVQTPWTLFWSTVSSFFLSLIPENPVGPVGIGAD